MTILKVTVEDENAGLLKKLLKEVSFVKSVEEEHVVVDTFREPEPPYARIKKIIDDAKGKNLFEDIKDPSEWQRELRKEWDRDF